MRGYAIADHSEVTDDGWFLERVHILSRIGVDLIQLRARHLDDRDLLGIASLCRERIHAPTRFFVNGRADIARIVEADGVQLPAEGVPVSVVRRISPRLEVGRSCHSVDDVRDAERDHADLVVLGPVFDARSSTKPAAVTIEDLEEASGVGVAVYAIGGFDLERLPSLKGTGVEGVAAITMFMTDEPISEIVARVHEVSTS